MGRIRVGLSGVSSEWIFFFEEEHPYIWKIRKAQENEIGEGILFKQESGGLYKFYTTVLCIEFINILSIEKEFSSLKIPIEKSGNGYCFSLHNAEVRYR